MELEEESTPLEEETETSGYQPRPLWQRIGAWIGLVLFVMVLIMYYINIMRGGL
ncbi:MAG: hypothetical protein IKU07_03440 [Oscillospiraceae bacterium]|nr:hypothetical protein [Oscillospiraceae bacterium]